MAIGEIDHEIAFRYPLAKDPSQASMRDAILHKRDAMGDPRSKRLVIGIEVDDRDRLGLDAHMLQENGKRATGDRTKTDEENPLVVCEHQGLLAV